MILVEFISIYGTKDRNVDTATTGYSNSVHLVASASFEFIRKSFGSIDSYTFELGS